MATSAAETQDAAPAPRAPGAAPSAGAASAAPPAAGSAPAGATPAGAGGASEPGAGAAPRQCANCGAPMAEGQDWCLACGAAAPGSLVRAGWRPVAAVIAGVLVLALGAAAASYAALNKHRAHPRALTTTVAQATPAPVTPLPKTPGGPAVTPKGVTGGAIGPGRTKPPKIPLTAITPKASEVAGAKAKSGAGASPTTSSGSTPASSGTSTDETSEAGEESTQAPILLDTDAASTYNPYEYPTSWFGDPARAIDGDSSTAWTAQVNPATAPNMAVGLLIDLHSKQKIGVLELITSTPGLTVQVYGATGRTAPASITDPAWVPLTAPKVPKKKHLRLPLRHDKQAFSFIALWISKAPSASVGTPAAPGHVAVDEVELFPPS